MTTAKSITCQSCGANLAYNGYQRTVRCEYCDTVNTIDTAGAKVAVVIVPGRTPGGGGGDGLSSTAARTRVLVAVGIAALLSSVSLGLCLRSGSQFRFGRGHERLGGRSGHASKPGSYLDCTAPLVRDIDRDGVEDLLGFQRVVTRSGRSRHVVAWSGADFRELWRSAAIGGPDAPPAALFDARTALVLAHEATVTALAPADGKTLWISQISDRVEALALGDGVIRVSTADQKRLVLDLKDGKLSESSPDDEDLQVRRAALAGSIHRQGTGVPGAPGAGTLLGLEAGRWPDLSLHAAFCPVEEIQRAPEERPSHSRRFELSGSGIRRARAAARPTRGGRGRAFVCQGELGVAYGVARAGSGTGVLIGYEPGGSDEVWRSRLALPGSVARVSQVPRVAFGPGRILVAYHLVSAGSRARLLSRQGTLSWDVALPGDPSGPAVGVELGPQRAYVRLPGKLLVLDRKDGKVLRTIPAT